MCDSLRPPRLVTQLGSLFQWYPTFSVMKFLLISSVDLPWWTLRRFSLLVLWRRALFSLLAGGVVGVFCGVCREGCENGGEKVLETVFHRCFFFYFLFPFWLSGGCLCHSFIEISFCPSLLSVSNPIVLGSLLWTIDVLPVVSVVCVDVSICLFQVLRSLVLWWNLMEVSSVTIALWW